MKVETSDKGVIVLKEVFNGIFLKAPSGCEIGICMRDSGFEIIHDDNVMINTMDYFSGEDVNHLDKKAITKRKMIRILPEWEKEHKEISECPSIDWSAFEERMTVPCGTVSAQENKKGLRVLVDGKDVTEDYFCSPDNNFLINNELTVESLKEFSQEKLREELKKFQFPPDLEKMKNNIPILREISILECWSKNVDMLVAFAINKLFEGYKVFIVDPSTGENTHKSIDNRIVLNLILKELKDKHGLGMHEVDFCSVGMMYIKLK